MALFSNLGFEDAGASPGLADGWTSAFTAAAAVFADFSGGAPAAPTPVEGFESGWGNDDYLKVLAPGDVTAAEFNTGLNAAAYESFEVEWNNDLYLLAVGAATGAVFDDGWDFESFENGWDNDTYLSVLGPGDVTAASFTGGAAYESFESAWGNDTYLTSLGPGDVTAASFDEGANAFEGFAALIAPFSFSVSSSVFQAAAHPLSNGNRVVFTGPGLPAEITVGLTYYVVNKNANDFQVSKTLGGLAVTVSDSSSTTMRCKGDPKVYWTESYDA